MRARTSSGLIVKHPYEWLMRASLPAASMDMTIRPYTRTTRNCVSGFLRRNSFVCARASS
jgi:hypothetical protein